ENAGKDVLISPYSLEADLSVLLCGLQGATRQELLSVMGLQGESEADINRYITTMGSGITEADNMTRFASSYSLWYKKELQLNAAFAEKVKGGYGVEVYPVQFGKQTTDKINTWCAEKTNNRIPKLLDSTSDTDIMHLLNAVYFRSNWAQHFRNTETRPFTAADGKVQKVETMWDQFSSNAFYALGNGYQMAGLPFNNGAFSMFFILPDEGKSVQDVMDTFEKKMPEVAAMQAAPSLKLYVPKFQSEYTILLEETMKALGASSLFSPSIDFRLFDGTQVGAERILQKTFLKIDEKGAEAAAATDIMMFTSTDGPKPEEIMLDLNRPFIYGIVEQSTGLPLFIGYKAKI
nr:hypothetical protein [Bacteroidaceae bacterium]